MRIIDVNSANANSFKGIIYKCTAPASCPKHSSTNQKDLNGSVNS